MGIIPHTSDVHVHGRHARHHGRAVQRRALGVRRELRRPGQRLVRRHRSHRQLPVQVQRDRRLRHELIVRTARDLAEAEGWDAVTTRRLADRVEYSQPVLYSHFENKDAIVRAVAIEGFADMAVQLRSARQGASSRDAAVRALAQAYLDFAATHPALYEAMFSLPIDVRFGTRRDPAVGCPERVSLFRA